MRRPLFNKLILVIGLCSIVSIVWSQDDNIISHNKAAMRAVGHQLLLFDGDSTSRVLPVIKNGDSYKIEFESPLSFKPDELSQIIDSVFTVQQVSFNYIVEVLECTSNEVAFSYEIGSYPQLESMACASREYPQACYFIEITLMDQQLNQMELTENSSTYYWWIIGFGLILAIVVIFLIMKNKNQQGTDLIMIGKYRFDKKKLKLYFENQEIELTNKEADLLSLLYESANSTLEREAILNVVWEDQGVYVGRTLDVFISKLRKKLEADSTVKILNIRGVGYKLVLDA